MRKKVIFLLLVIVFPLFTSVLRAQKKLVIMGSSTAAGNGASSYANSWAGKIAAYFRQNMSDGLDTITTNIALSGYTTYLEMPTGFIPPAGRPSPDVTANITKALSYSPNVVIINLPTNDVVEGYTPRETMDNFRLMYTAITAAGAKCFITTTQPRNLSDAQRTTLRNLKDSIMLNFGIYSIDFFTGTADANYFIKPEFSAGDGIHLNDAGHNFLFTQVRNKQIFASNSNIPLPVLLTDFQAQSKNNTTILKWHTDQEEANTFYEIQRSATGANFETLYTQAGIGTGQAADYSWTDQSPLPGKSFYRLNIIEPARQSYSKTISVLSKTSDLNINKLYKDNGSSNLIAEIGVQKSQAVVINIISITGTLVQTETKYLAGPSEKVILPISRLAAGQYFLSITGIDNSHAVKAFSKE